MLPRHHPNRHDTTVSQLGAADEPLDMGRRRDAPRASGDHLLFRPQPLRPRQGPQVAQQTAGRLADAAPMPLAGPQRTVAPERAASRNTAGASRCARRRSAPCPPRTCAAFRKSGWSGGVVRDVGIDRSLSLTRALLPASGASPVVTEVRAQSSLEGASRELPGPPPFERPLRGRSQDDGKRRKFRFSRRVIRARVMPTTMARKQKAGSIVVR